MVTIEEADNEVRKAMDEGFELFKKKNRDYGNSFFESDDKLNSLQEIKRKFARIKSIYENNPELNVNETVEDTLRDLGNYAFMEIARLRLKG